MKSMPRRRDERRAMLGEAIRNARRMRKVTQQELARRLGRTQSSLSKIEKGERNLDVVELLEFAKALGVDPCQILKDVG